MVTAYEQDRDLVPYFAIAMFAGLRPETKVIREQGGLLIGRPLLHFQSFKSV